MANSASANDSARSDDGASKDKKHDTLVQKIEHAASASIADFSLPFGIRMALFGLGCGVLAWLIEWAIGSRLSIPGLTSYAGSWPSIAGIILAVLINGAVGSLYGAAVVFFSRRMVRGQLRVFDRQTPWVAIHPVWWVRFLIDFAIVFVGVLGIGAVWALGQWVLLGDKWLQTFKWSAVSEFVGIAFLIGIAGSCGQLVGHNMSGLLQKLWPYLLKSQHLWWTLCATGGLVIAAFVYAMLLGIGYLADPFFVAASLGSSHTLTTALAMLPLAGLAGVTAAKIYWSDRSEMLRPAAQSETMQLAAQNDFRNWDLNIETFQFGITADGFPFYVWRESADNRLGLSRPRYCCIEPRNGELQFVFFNPSQDVRPSGGMAVFYGVTALVAAMSLAAYWGTPRPYVPYAFDERPPPFLVLLGIALYSPTLGALTGGAWHIVAIVMRWYRNRFQGEGRISRVPLRSLSGFSTLHAGEAGAIVYGEKAKTGHGLAASLEDGSMMILTGNAWNYSSIAEKHRDLTIAFRDPRDAFIAKWAEQNKQSGRSQTLPTETPKPEATDGVPSTL